MYLDINNAPDLRRVPFVLASIAIQMYALLLLLGPISMPGKQKELTFNELVNALAKHFGLEAKCNRWEIRVS